MIQLIPLFFLNIKFRYWKSYISVGDTFKEYLKSSTGDYIMAVLVSYTHKHYT